MALSTEAVYNELSGEDTFQILMTRFQDLLKSVPEFHRNITLSRVKIDIDIRLEVAGRTPPVFNVVDSFTVRSSQPGLNTFDDEITLRTAINADTDYEEGQPADQIREEHGIAVMKPFRGPMGMEDRPALNPPEPKYEPYKPILKGNTLTVELDNGPARNRREVSAPLEKNQGRSSPDVGVQTDFRESKRTD